jgi:phosphohistidine phosphatase
VTLMKLYVLRHGEAESVEEAGGVDAKRRLTEEGAECIRKEATAMRRMRIEPEFIWTSPYVRALETAQITLEMLGFGQIEVLDELRPGAVAEELAKLIQTRGGSSLIIVGHNPDLEDLISYLLKKDTTGSISLKKGSMALLRVERPIGPGTGSLLQMWTPRYLMKMADK